VQADWFEREAQGAVVGGGNEADGITYYVVEFNVFCFVFVSVFSLFDLVI
jgi:hypothetical protein